MLFHFYLYISTCVVRDVRKSKLCFTYKISIVLVAIYLFVTLVFSNVHTLFDMYLDLCLCVPISVSQAGSIAAVHRAGIEMKIST
jgi:hypothetical protein